MSTVLFHKSGTHQQIIYLKTRDCYYVHEYRYDGEKKRT